MTSTRIFQTILFGTAALFLALWLGLGIATEQTETLVKVVGTIVVLFCLFLGKRIWLILPLTAALGITLRIPGRPDTLLLGMILFIGFSMILLFMRKIDFRFRWTESHFWMLCLTLMIAQVYVRNPAGVSMFGGDTVGGRPYVVFLVTLITAVFLSSLRVPQNELKWIFPLTIAGGILSFIIQILGVFVPQVAFMTGSSFARSDEVNYENYGTAVDTGAASRITFFAVFSQNLSCWIAAWLSPLKAILRPLPCLLVISCLVMATMGGYRNTLAIVAMNFAVGIAYRSGLSGILAAMLLGITGLVALSITNTVTPLPPNMQRALTSLPGTWEQRYKDDAKGSTDWRREIWIEALTSERWIRNKWIGDGLGFGAEDLQIGMSAKGIAGISGIDAQREQVLINGDYHSGPVSTIRVIGYTGLVLFLLAQFRLGLLAHRMIIGTRGSRWHSLCLLMGIPTIVSPVIFVFVFGDFKSAITSYLISVAMLNLIRNSLELQPILGRAATPESSTRQRPIGGMPQTVAMQ